MPHVAKTAQQPGAYVWAVDGEHAPSYWFPRQCPRAMGWVGPRTTEADRALILGPGGGERVHAVEWAWLERIAVATLFAYRLPADRFRPFAPDDTHAWVATEPVEPLGPPAEITDLLGLHAAAGIQLRLLPELWTFWDAVVGSTLEFSGIRLANARPRL